MNTAADDYINLDWRSGRGRADVSRGSFVRRESVRAVRLLWDVWLLWDDILRSTAERRAGGGGAVGVRVMGRRTSDGPKLSGPFSHELSSSCSSYCFSLAAIFLKGSARFSWPDELSMECGLHHF